VANQSYRRSKHPRSKKTAIKPSYEAPIDPKAWEESLAGNREAFPDADALFGRLDVADPGTGFKGNKT
jgi:hypothetical protein